MIGKLGNLLLVIGTVFGALAAADSVKAYRHVDLTGDEDLAGEFLFLDVPGATDDPESNPPPILALQGQALSAELVAGLRAAGVERVRVRRPALAFEPVTLAEAEGRVLHGGVALGGSSESIRAGRIITRDLVERARAAGVLTLAVRDGEALDLTAEGLDLGRKARLAEDIDLPFQIPAGTYLDATRLAELTEAEVEMVDVKTPAAWNLADWTQRWNFLGAVLAILAGVLLNRRGARASAVQATPSAGGTVEEPGAVLERLVAETEALAGRVETLDAPALHAALDALLSGPLYTLVEGREALRARHGVRAATAFMAPLATAERQLNRAWSAAVDGATEESRDCVGHALAPLREARAAFPAS